MAEIKAIPTEYNGIMFRSKLEAQWAKFFDNLCIKWSYEVEGYEFSNGVKYLPDFYLTEQDCFFEVKGIMNEFDERKIKTLVKESNKPCFIGYSNGEIDLLLPEYDECVSCYSGSIIYCNYYDDCLHGGLAYDFNVAGYEAIQDILPKNWDENKIQINPLRFYFNMNNLYFNNDEWVKYWNENTRIEVINNVNRVDFNS